MGRLKLIYIGCWFPQAPVGLSLLSLTVEGFDCSKQDPRACGVQVGSKVLLLHCDFLLILSSNFLKTSS